MKVIGLTGGTGSGKGVISQFLKLQGSAIVDADAIAHLIIEKGQPAYKEIVEYFGNEILDQNESIIRKKLGAIVFADAQKLSFLNQCTYHYIYEEVIAQIAAYKLQKQYNFIVLDAPLFNDTLADLCDEVWVVYAEEETRIQRIMARDNISLLEAKNRVQSQKSFEHYQKYATHVLNNTQDAYYLTQQVIALIQGDGKGLECSNLRESEN